MKNSKIPQFQSTNRIGFHYFPDTTHYTNHDLAVWLPELKKLNATSLVLLSDATRAIPEHFLSALIGAGITPIVHFPLSLPDAPNPADIKAILEAYARWGIQYVIFFDKPNSRSSWSASGWGQQDLIERFLDKFIPLANVAIQAGLTPVFPPLEPGGNYWDTTFLSTAFQALNRRKQNQLVERMMISGYAFTSGKPLNWGAGGPSKWKQNRPYFTPQGSEDQRGFRLYEWYQAIAQETFQHEIPMLLLGVGIKNDQPAGSYAVDEHKKVVKEILAEMDSLPAYIGTCAFYLLSTENNSPQAEFAWYPTVDNPRPVVQNLVIKEEANTVSQSVEIAEKAAELHSIPEDTTHPIAHYLLLPVYEWGVADWHLEAIKPFVKKYQPTIGYSLKEAALAQKVTVVGGEQTFPQSELDKLIESGSQVDRIAGDGTTIATLLAER